MGLSGGSKSTSTTGSAQAWAQPIAQGAANMGTQIQGQAQPLINGLTNTISGQIPGLAQSYAGNQQMINGNAQFLNGIIPGLSNAFGNNYSQINGLSNQIGGAVGGALNAYNSPNAASATLPQLLQRLSGGADPTMQASQGYVNDVLGGKYLNGNPYLDAALQRTRQDVTNDVNSQFEAAGRYGSGAQTDVLTRRLADSENQARMADYQNQQARMDQAAGLGGQLSQAQNANQTQNVNNYLNAANSANSISNTQFGQALGAAGQSAGLAGQAYTGLNPLLQTAGAVSGQANASYGGLPYLLSATGEAAGLPFTGYSAYANGLGSLFNGGTQTSSTSNGIGGLLGGVGSILSGFGALKGS